MAQWPRQCIIRPHEQTSSGERPLVFLSLEVGIAALHPAGLPPSVGAEPSGTSLQGRRGTVRLGTTHGVSCVQHEPCLGNGEQPPEYCQQYDI